MNFLWIKSQVTDAELDTNQWGRVPWGRYLLGMGRGSLSSSRLLWASSSLSLLPFLSSSCSVCLFWDGSSWVFTLCDKPCASLKTLQQTNLITDGGQRDVYFVLTDLKPTRRTCAADRRWRGRWHSPSGLTPAACWSPLKTHTQAERQHVLHLFKKQR